MSAKSIFALVLLMAGLGVSDGATLTFDTLPTGIILSNQLQSAGVVFSSLDVTGCCPPGRVVDVSKAELGISDFGGSLPRAVVCGNGGDQLTFRFVLPDGSPAKTDSVSLRIGDGDSPPESFRVSFRAFDGSLLNAQEFTTTAGRTAGGVTVSFTGSAIHRVEILTLSAPSGCAVDDLSFATPVSVDVPRLSIVVSQVRLCWDSLTNRLYQVQYRSEATTNRWVDLGAPVRGTGTNCVTDAVAGPPRIFRVVALP